MSIVVLASLAAAQAPVTLQYHPKVGSSYKFSINSTISNQRGTANITAVSNIKILSFTGGYYRVETKITDVKNGGKEAGPNIPKTTTILDYDKFGAVKFDPKATNGSMPQVMGNFNNQALGMQFPKKPVKVGDTWSNTVDLGALFTAMMKGPGSKAQGTVKLVFKLAQLSAKTATVTCTLAGTIDMHMMSPQTKTKAPQPTQVTLSMNGNGQYIIERSTGIHMSSNMSMGLSSASNGHRFTSTQTVSMKRL